MKIFSKLFSCLKRDGDTAPVNDIVREIDPLINRACIDLFAANSEVLLKKPVDYIVPAVWGTKKDTQPDEVQKEIFRRIKPVEDSIIQSFGLKNFNSAQEFGVRYLIKGLFIARILHMTEMAKNLSSDTARLGTMSESSLLLH